MLSYEKPATAFSRTFFPLPEPVAVAAGDVVRMHMGVINKPITNYVWSWRGTISDVKGRVMSEWGSSTFHLLPFQPQDAYMMKSFSLDNCPKLNRDGRIRRFILDRLDGSTPIRRIADELFRKFPEDLPSMEKAIGQVTRAAKKCNC